MIYILVQEVSDDSDCGCSQGRPVFAHHDKKVIEKVHAAIQENFKRWNELAKRWSNDVEKIRKLMPRPTEPDYSKLPPRPLVWKDDINRGWNNAFLEYSEQVSLHDKKVDKEIDRLKKEYAEYYHEPEERFNDIWSYLSPRSYSVEEIEDNPNVDIGTL